MNNILIFQAADEAATRALGHALATVLPAGAVVALMGPLGAGKTRLVQAVAEATGVDPALVTSPTFVLLHEYIGLHPIVHFDVYRLRDDDEFIALGPEEYFAGTGWTFIEWADRVAAQLPADRLEITIEISASSARRFTLRGLGPRSDQVVVAVEKILPSNPADEH